MNYYLRYLITTFTMGLYLYRVSVSNWIVVTYLIEIYHLSILEKYLTPLGLPLPSSDDNAWFQDDDWKQKSMTMTDIPLGQMQLQRKLSEYDLWKQNLISIIIDHVFIIFDWPDIYIWRIGLVLWFMVVLCRFLVNMRTHQNKYQYKLSELNKTN